MSGATVAAPAMSGWGAYCMGGGTTLTTLGLGCLRSFIIPGLFTTAGADMRCFGGMTVLGGSVRFGRLTATGGVLLPSKVLLGSFGTAIGASVGM